jgi:intergrase/recombinase
MDECLEFTKYKAEKSCYIGLTDLVNSNIIARGPSETIYFINPMVAFNGDRVTFAKTFVKKRMKSKGIDPNQTSLMGLLNQEHPELPENKNFDDENN